MALKTVNLSGLQWALETSDLPIISQDHKSRLWQRYISIFSTLAAMDMDAHAVTVDIADL